MSGAIVAATIASAAAGIGSTIYGIKSGQDLAAVQQQALKNQNTAQQKAEAASLSTQRQSEVAQNAVNQKTPDVSSILQRAATAGNAGQSSTMLTSPTGINTSSLNLGKQTLLGQ